MILKIFFLQKSNFPYKNKYFVFKSENKTNFKGFFFTFRIDERSKENKYKYKYPI
jgi:hypothetical protein